MNVKSSLLVSGLLLALAVGAFAQDVAEYQPLMKAGASANGMMQKSIEADLNAAASQAAQVQSAFGKIAQFWAQHNVADAQEAAQKIVTAAGEVEAAAKAGNKDGAMAAAKQIGANCGSCHMAHRERTADGFAIK
jgi:mono/diheme cytochrome c family protein